MEPHDKSPSLEESSYGHRSSDDRRASTDRRTSSNRFLEMRARRDGHVLDRRDEGRRERKSWFSMILPRMR